MKIEVTKCRQEVEFSSIEVGECFMFGGNYFMKTDLRSSDDKSDVYHSVNCVRLDDGHLDAFCSNCDVFPIKSTLLVMRKE